MFDVSFLELAVIAIIALIVLGPERLPTAARTAGLWIGRIKRTVANVQRDITSQLEAEELQRQLKKQRSKVDEGLSRAREEVERLGDDERSSGRDNDERSAVSRDSGTHHPAESAAVTDAEHAITTPTPARDSDSRDTSVADASSSDADRDCHPR